MKDIILAGISASGKGTQSKKLLEYFWEKIKYFETGDILRSLQSSDNAIGNYLKDLTKNGLLVKDEVVSWLFSVFLETLNVGDVVLWDGCMRRLGQTQAIAKQLTDRARKFIVIELLIPEEEVNLRLENRITCSSCGSIFNKLLHGKINQCLECNWKLYRRNDDADLSAINNRIEVYKNDIIPALDWLDQQWLLIRIDGMKNVDEIFDEILQIVTVK